MIDNSVMASDASSPFQLLYFQAHAAGSPLPFVDRGIHALVIHAGFYFIKDKNLTEEHQYNVITLD